MFDIGFAELLVIGLVSLIVIGPNRLPEAIRTLALWLGRARRTYSQFRKDLEQEIGADEIRQELHNEEIMAQLKDTQQQIKQNFDLDTKPSSAPKQQNPDDKRQQQSPLHKPSQPEQPDD